MPPLRQPLGHRSTDYSRRPRHQYPHTIILPLNQLRHLVSKLTGPERATSPFKTTRIAHTTLFTDDLFVTESQS